MSFNSDPPKQAVQIIFTRKSKQIDHPKIYFNDMEVKTINVHKHLGLILGSMFSFASHIIENISKARKGFGIIIVGIYRLPTMVPLNLFPVFCRLKHWIR